VLSLRKTKSDAPGALTGATPANFQSTPTVPMEAEPVIWSLLML
jgi:hypothetical protein